MLRNYLTVAIRNLWRNKIYATVSIGGLALGLAAVFIIARFVFEEVGYDRFEKGDRIYRVIIEKDSPSAHSQPILTGVIRSEIPEIEQVARLDRHYQDHSVIRVDNRLERVEPFYFVDPEFFNIFTVPLLQGDPNTCLADPRSMVVTTDFVEQYLAAGDPLDQTVTIQYRGSSYDMRVTGVLDELPKNTLFNPDVVLPMSLMGPDVAIPMNLMTEAGPESVLRRFWLYSVMTLLITREGVTGEEALAKIQAVVDSKLPEGVSIQYSLQPLSEVHLRSGDIQARMGVYGSIERVRLYSAIALAILIIAGINFINLSVAQASRRLREVGIRKVVGSGRGAIIGQLMGESLLVTLIALPVAAILLQFILPVANQMLSREMELSLAGNFPFVLSMVLLAILVGVICGSITALYLSAVQPVAHLMHRSTTLTGSPWARRIMIAFQFVTFSGLLVASLVFRSQMDYLRNAQLGYNKEQVVVMNLPDSDTEQKWEVLKANLLENTSIEGVTITSSVPPWFGNWMSTGEGTISVDFIVADIDYLHTLDIPILAGRNIRDGDVRGFLLNETAYNTFFPGESFREGMTLMEDNKPVIGVMRDFHIHPLYDEITPLALVPITPDRMEELLACIAVRLAAGRIPEGIAAIQNEWQDIYPDELFTYEFIDDAFARVHESDRIFGYLIHFFTILAILVACMGLFGLVTFATQRRTKEIGIRKVVGASVAQVVTLLSKEFLVLVLIANVIAWPIAWFAMSRWLENFAYRIELGVGVFFLAGALALLIALATISWQTVRAATANPVESLRYE